MRLQPWHLFTVNICYLRHLDNPVTKIYRHTVAPKVTQFGQLTCRLQYCPQFLHTHLVFCFKLLVRKLVSVSNRINQLQVNPNTFHAAVLKKSHYDKSSFWHSRILILQFRHKLVGFFVKTNLSTVPRANTIAENEPLA